MHSNADWWKDQWLKSSLTFCTEFLQKHEIINKQKSRTKSSESVWIYLNIGFLLKKTVQINRKL